MNHYEDVRKALTPNAGKFHTRKWKQAAGTPASIQPAKPRRKPTGSTDGADNMITTMLREGKPPKKSRKLPTTPRSRVRSALRQVWLRSRERAAALKAAGNCCARCGVKASKAKGREVSVQVHHRNGIEAWEAIIDLVFAELLASPPLLKVMCTECHKVEHVE